MGFGEGKSAPQGSWHSHGFGSHPPTDALVCNGASFSSAEVKQGFCVKIMKLLINFLARGFIGSGVYSRLN